MFTRNLVKIHKQSVPARRLQVEELAQDPDGLYSGLEVCLLSDSTTHSADNINHHGWRRKPIPKSHPHSRRHTETHPTTHAGEYISFEEFIKLFQQIISCDCFLSPHQRAFLYVITKPAPVLSPQSAPQNRGAHGASGEVAQLWFMLWRVRMFRVTVLWMGQAVESRGRQASGHATRTFPGWLH